jgi:hypothetical protein
MVRRFGLCRLLPTPSLASFGVDLRLLGALVPSSYGPSGDE